MMNLTSLERLCCLVKGKPSAQSWVDILEWITTAPAHEQRVLVEELRPHLTLWPEEIRTFTCSNVDQWVRQAPSWWPLVASLTVERFSAHTIRDVRRLAYSPRMVHLSRLDLSGNLVGAAGALVIAQSSYFRNLTTLRLNACAIGNGGAQALAQSPYLHRLTTLELQTNGLTDDGVGALVQSSKLRGLSVLDLSYNAIGTQGAEALAQSPCMQTLTTLKLRSNLLGSRGVHALARSPYLTKLNTLDLEDNMLHDEGAKALSTLNQLHVQTLNLGANGISAQGAQALADAFTVKGLVELNLSGNVIGASGAEALAKSPWLKHIHTLNLSGCQIRDAGVEALVDSPYLHHTDLKVLNLSSNQIGVAGVEALVKSPLSEGLDQLDLSFNFIGADEPPPTPKATHKPPCQQKLTRRNLRFYRLCDDASVPSQAPPPRKTAPVQPH
ncbi:MAG: hypothetical protein AAFX99_28855 [Myxococcota bacterium]